MYVYVSRLTGMLLAPKRLGSRGDGKPSEGIATSKFRVSNFKEYSYCKLEFQGSNEAML